MRQATIKTERKTFTITRDENRAGAFVSIREQHDGHGRVNMVVIPAESADLVAAAIKEIME